jgi:hypothetical protein
MSPFSSLFRCLARRVLTHGVLQNGYNLEMRIDRRYRALILFAVFCAGILVWRQYTLHWIAQRHAQLEWLPPTEAPLGVREFRLVHGKVPWSLWFWRDQDGIDFVQFETDKLRQADLHRIDEIKRLFPEATVAAKTASEWDSEETKIVQERQDWFKNHPVDVEIDITDVPGFRKFSRGNPKAGPSEHRRGLGDWTFARVYVLPSTSTEDKQKAAALFPEADILELPRDYP